LKIDRDGVICLTAQTGQEFGLFMVAGNTFFIDKDGRTFTLSAFKSLTNIVAEPVAKLVYA